LRRRAIIAVVAAIVAGLIAGWYPGAAGASTGSSANTIPIVVGSDGDLAAGPGVAEGFEAGIVRFNKAGGLAGRQIKFVGIANDGFSPASALSNTQQLVESKHIFAMVPVESTVADGSTGLFLADHNVPFIGWATNAAFATQTRWGFGIDGNQGNPQVQGVAGMTQVLAAMQKTKTPGQVRMALIANNIPGSIVANNALAGAAKVLGIHVVYQQTPVATTGTTSYAPYAQSIMSSGANAVYEVLGAPDSIGLAAALKSEGFKGLVVNGVTYLPGDLAGQPNEAAALNGVYVESLFPVGENASPAVKQEQKDLVSVGQAPYLTSGISVGYWSAIVFEQMLRATLQSVGGDATKVTGAALEKMVNNGFTYRDPISGGIGPEYFPAARTIPTGCGTLVKTVGTGYKQIAPFQCPGAVNIASGKKLNPKTGQPTS
jgi:ABC-type branched-subunit amino acid transport system substrate-binding protein